MLLRPDAATGSVNLRFCSKGRGAAMRRGLAAAVIVALTVLYRRGCFGRASGNGRLAVSARRRAAADGVVATESPEASQAGLEVLDGGGNAVDAAVAAVFALNVARPQSCGIGGGGFMVYRGADGETAALDFRETAPAAIEPDAFGGDGIYNAYTGHKTVGVPGTVAGMREGARPLRIHHARGGHRAGREPGPRRRRGLRDDLRGDGQQPRPPQALPGQPRAVSGRTAGRPYEPGSILVQPDLADTLALIAEEGTGGLLRR